MLEQSLGEVAVFVNGDRSANYPSGTDFVPHGIPFISATDLADGLVNWGSTKRITNAAFARLSNGKTAIGDLLFSLRGSLGKVARVSDEATAAISSSLVIVRAKEAVLQDYLFYLLSGPVGQRAAQLLNNGSVQGNISVRDLKTTPVLIPPLHRQRAIVSILRGLDGKIELGRRICETVEAMSAAVFRDWFIDFGPVRRKMEGVTDNVAVMGGLAADPTRATRLAAMFPGALDQDDLPERWRRFRLSELATLCRGQVSPQDSPGETFRHYSLPAFDAGASPALDSGASIKSGKFHVPAGAVLVSKLNPDISRVWLPEDGAGPAQVASTEFLVLQPKHGRSLLYALCRDADFRRRLESMVTGTSKSHQRVSPTVLMEQVVIAGTEATFSEFNALASDLHGRVLSSRAENRTLAETRDYLLPRLMSGQVRVEEAAEMAQSAA